MKSNILTYSLLLLVLPLASCFTRHKAGKSKNDGNYNYIYNSACNCVYTTNNPNGIVNITVASYETDPDLHHINGYYTNLTGKKSDTLVITNLSPTVYQCNPCVTIENDKKYIFYFEGKDTLPSVEIKITKTASGSFKELR